MIQFISLPISIQADNNTVSVKYDVLIEFFPLNTQYDICHSLVAVLDTHYHT